MEGAIQYNDTIEECMKKKFDGASQCSLEDWISTLAKGGGANKRFPYCLNPNSFNQFLYFRASQGHSGDNAIDPELHHVGNISELLSIIRIGLIS